MIRIVIEPREPDGAKTPDQLIKELEEHQIIQDDERADSREDQECANVGEESTEVTEK